MNSTRIEKDSMGEMNVPADAYYGAQTARALENFPVSPIRFSRRFIRALGLIKTHAAQTNESLGLLSQPISNAIQQAAAEVIRGDLDQQFVVDIFQTGSGTSTHMNANEVIANRASEILCGQRNQHLVHPNDHVNYGQSSNDVFPTALHIAVLESLHHDLISALQKLQAALETKSQEFYPILKIGRTHLQDATPMRLGQEFSGFASQIQHSIRRLNGLDHALGELALGGTAVGTGINTHVDFAPRTIARLALATGLDLREAPNHFEAQSSRDACVEASGALKTVAVSLMKIANEIRTLGSGPRCGIGELLIPAVQPGSSIMPGKVNPVMSEMLLQIGAQVIGNDASLTVAGLYSQFQLNTMMPLMAHQLLQSCSLLTNGVTLFTNRCVVDLKANSEQCESTIEQSLAMCTALAPVIGYDQAAAIAKQAYAESRTIREVALEVSGLDPESVHRLLDPTQQTQPAS